MPRHFEPAQHNLHYFRSKPMAHLTADTREANGYFPAVCMVCGQPATMTKTKAMSWCPPWVGVLILFGVLPYAVVAAILTKRAAVQAPFCDRHHGHWVNRLLLLWSLVFVFGFIGASL